MNSKKHDAVVYRYHEFLKELYIDCQYIEPINLSRLVAKHQIAAYSKTAVTKMNIIQRVQINGRVIPYRYTWISDEPNVNMAIDLVKFVGNRQKKYDPPKKSSGYWQTTSYLFGLIKTKKWVENK